MTRPGVMAGGRLGFEAFGTAVGLAVILGSLSAVVADLVPVTGTLAALALAGWATLPRRRVARSGPLGPATVAALLPLALGAGAYLAPPPSFEAYRGLALALGLLPLWLVERGGGRTRRRGVAA